MADTVKTFDRQTARFLAVVAENFPEMPAVCMQIWSEQPKRIKEVLLKAFEPLVRIPVWWRKTVKPVVHNARSWKEVFTQRGFTISDDAQTMLENVLLLPFPETEYTMTTADTLGYWYDEKNPPSRVDYYRRAKMLGLEPISVQAALQVLLEERYSDRPKSNPRSLKLPEQVIFVLGTEPISITDKDGATTKKLFIFENYGDRNSLRAMDVESNKFLHTLLAIHKEDEQ